MRNGVALSVTMLVLLAGAGRADAHSIPADKVNDQKIFWGSAASFTKPGEVDYQAIVKATPEYASIKKKKIKSGTAKYWILISKASDHAVRVISQVGRESDYDLVVAKDYLSALDPPIPTVGITDLVLKRLRSEGKDGSRAETGK